MVDAIELSQALIRCRSVTPEDGGALAVVEAALRPLGFVCHRLKFQAPSTEAVENLYARLGTAAPNFCFAGHTDVVPPGDESAWHVPPFEGRVEKGLLHGRGAADMKSAVAAFIAAVSEYVKNGTPKGSISLLITGDEEGIAINGTKAVLDWMTEKGEAIDHCLVGEPTSTARAGDTLKIGRRGSMQIRFVAKGTQGHTAYPQRAINPIPVLAKLVTLLGEPLDAGTAHFEPSTLVFTSFDVGNPASNVSPAEARAVCNVRFNDSHTPDGLLARARKAADAVVGNSGCIIEIETSVSGVSFVTEPGAFTDLLSAAVTDVTGAAPQFSTTGGTSDARFIKDHCPVAELGLSGSTMHKTDECVPVEEVVCLTNIYKAVLTRYFELPP